MKRFTVLLLMVGMLIMGAGSAHAVNVPPSALDDQSWAMFGMGLQGNYTANMGYFSSSQQLYNSSSLQSPYKGFFFNATHQDSGARWDGFFSVNASVTVTNSTSILGAANIIAGGTNVAGIHNYTLDTHAIGKGVPGLVRFSANFTNHTVTYGSTREDYVYAFAAPDYSLMVGISNKTGNNTIMNDHAGAQVRNLNSLGGVSLLPMVQRSSADTLTTRKKGMAGTWSVFSLVLDNNNRTQYRVGEFAINEAATGGVWKGHDAYAASADGGAASSDSGASNYTTTGSSNRRVSYAVDFGSGLRNLRIVNGSITSPNPWIAQNATVNPANTTMIGFSNASDGGAPSLMVAFKDGTVGDASDFTNRYIKIVSAGTGKAGASSAEGNSSGRMVQMTVDGDGKISSGNMTIIGGNPASSVSLGRSPHVEDMSIAGYTMNLGTRTIADVQFRNITLLDEDGHGTGDEIFGRWNKDKTAFAGIWFTTSGTYQLTFALPTAAASSNFTKATPTTTYWTNATLAADFSVAGTYNGEMTMSAESMRDAYGLPSYFTPLTGVKYFNASTATVAPSAKIWGYDGVYFTGSYTVSGIGGSLDTYRIYKLQNTTSDGAAASTYSSRLFTRQDSRTTSKDGSWWMEQAGTVLTSGALLDPSVEYNVYFVIKDDGNYDLSKDTTGTIQILDPQVLGTTTAVPGSSSSSTGCVFNPAAGFGLEWLLLLLAPAIGIVRSRFKK